MEAAIAATLVIDKVLGSLGDYLASPFEGVVDPELFENLVSKLRKVKTEIEHRVAWDNDVLRIKLEQVAEVAQDLELVIDTYLLRVAQRRNRPLIFRLVSSGSSINSQIQEISVKLQWIHKVLAYGVDEGSGSSEYGDRFVKPLFFTPESEVLVTDYQKEQIQSAVVGELPSTRLVISLVGFCGLGKTTLARIIYRDKMVEQHFDCRAWIDVSNYCVFGELLRALASQICLTAGDINGEDIEEMSLQRLSSHLNQYLSMKRYLIVFDDVWETDFWQNMNLVLPNNSTGSRIIIITRMNAIADSCGIVQNLKPLSEDRTLELFCKMAFGSEFGVNCPVELEELSLAFVRRCHGFPLVIILYARFLSTQEKDVSVWKRLLDNFSSEFEEMAPIFRRVASEIIPSAYDDRTFRITACLLYFSVFPEGFVVPDLKLYTLWIAEGFIKEETDKTLEEVAATYLNELINKNLVQVSYIDYYGKQRMCRVHALMFDVISSMARGFGICQKSKQRRSRRESRRLSIHGDTKNIVDTTENSMVRSVFLFNVNEPMSLSLMVNLFETFKLLELLDFENAPLIFLPNEVGNLFYLKYLSLRNTKVKKLPKSVGLLLNLQTLDVRNTLMHELPNQILKLQKLRHLLASAHNDGVTFDSIHGLKVKEGIGCLENLQTLLTVQAHSSGFGVIEELEKLRQLRWLSISKLTAVIVNSICTSIEKMNHLESLSLYSSNGNETFDLESTFSPPPSLRRLILTCQLEKLPDWISKLQNLSILGLSFSRLGVDPLKAVQGLPNLVSLWLHRAYTGEQLHFEEDGFQKLKQLVLTELYDLRMMRIEKGALPLLEELRMGPTSDEFSSDIQHLSNLQVLEYYDMPDEFVLRLQPESGLDYWKVKHVPCVVFRFRARGRHYASYKLGDPGLLAHVKGLFRTTNVEQHERPLSFFYKDDEELATTSSARWSERWSFFSDDVED